MVYAWLEMSTWKGNRTFWGSASVRTLRWVVRLVVRAAPKRRIPRSVRTVAVRAKYQLIGGGSVCSPFLGPICAALVDITQTGEK
ncbi:hypothetical protein P3T27_000191 [Kitasatospora sp. MAA19]|uniref:hypothetical protein n=1 Tax=Kitasatospora sp. MAA19 TaxID=3035090 RepID=UPI00247596BF|nr:hypothetical protein [Kitasatospora sp. MAA19]MDH6703510.1 hypothetical protein [Kitasatospora sp. MAA19]